MAYEKQIILVPSDLASVGQWVDASFDYQKRFQGVHVTHDPAAENLCRFDAITVVGSAQQWGRDMVAFVGEVCPEARIDFVSASMPAELYFALQERVNNNQRYGEAPPAGFRLRWPTDYPKTTQPFRANAAYYSRFKCDGVPLPGHEGIDIRAPMYERGSNIYACADGVVYSIHQTDDGNAYGARVRINHDWEGERYQTVYAHLTEHSITVKPGDRVQAGQLIGISDNTGNSSGAHLHLTFKKFGATEAGDTDYPCDLMDPTPYLYWPNLHLTPTVRLRVRANPNASAATLAVLAPGTPLTPEGYHADVLWKIWHSGSWIKIRTAYGLAGYCAAQYLEVMDEDEPVPAIPTPTGRFVAGVHGRVGAPMEEADYMVVQMAQMASIKLLSTEPPETVARLRQIDPNMFIVVRVYQDLYDYGANRPRSLSPEEYARAFAPAPAGQTKTDLQRFYDQGVRYFELHNEPNLAVEGFGGAWSSGTEYERWWLEVRARLMAWFPEARWGFSPMSPGVAYEGTRPVDMWTFLGGCGTAIGKADWLAIHQYFRSFQEMEASMQDIVWEYRRRWPDKVLMMTEFGNPYDDVSKAAKGQQYASYYNMIDDVPGMAAAFGWVISAPVKFESQTWREENGRPTAIVQAVAGRA